jgi:hypothetical protein
MGQFSVEICPEVGQFSMKLNMRQSDGTRAVFGARRLFQENPASRDFIPFHEYFHGDSGAGLGASHQTGWTGLIALLLMPRPGIAASEPSRDVFRPEIVSV